MGCHTKKIYISDQTRRTGEVGLTPAKFQRIQRRHEIVSTSSYSPSLARPRRMTHRARIKKPDSNIRTNLPDIVMYKPAQSKLSNNERVNNPLGSVYFLCYSKPSETIRIQVDSLIDSERRLQAFACQANGEIFFPVSGRRRCGNRSD